MPCMHGLCAVIAISGKALATSNALLAHPTNVPLVLEIRETFKRSNKLSNAPNQTSFISVTERCERGYDRGLCKPCCRM